MILGWNLGTWKCSIVLARVASQAQHHINLAFLLSDCSSCKPVCFINRTIAGVSTGRWNQAKGLVCLWGTNTTLRFYPLQQHEALLCLPISRIRWACLMKGPTLESLSGLLLLMWGKTVLKKKKVNFELQMFCLGVREDQKQEFSNAKLEVIWKGSVT